MPIARLRRVDVTLYRNQSADDPTQVPNASARIDFYRQGATVSSSSVTIPNEETEAVDVYDIGRLEAGSEVTAGAGGPTLQVAEVESPTRVRLSNGTGSPVTLLSGTRLLLISDRPVLYQDPFGAATPRPSARWC